MKKVLTILTCLILAVAVVSIAVAESKYASGTTSAAVTFGPGSGRTVIKAIYAETDKLGGAVKISARTGSRAAPTATPTNGQTVISISNASMAFTTNDVVVYSHANGTQDYTTLSDADATSVTLAAGVTIAGASGDYLYEITQDFEMEVGGPGTGAGTNDYLRTAGDALYISPGDSPVYIVVDGTANAVLAVTVDK